MKVWIGWKPWQKEAEGVKCECPHSRKGAFFSGQAPVPSEGEMTLKTQAVTWGICSFSMGLWLSETYASVNGVLDGS